MKILIIDSHKSTRPIPVQNLHWINSYQLANALGAELIWSFPNVNDNIKSNYDAIIFVHASQYTYVDYAWLEQSPNAELYYVLNEYNLGEPRTLWLGIKEGREYTLLSNHNPNKGNSKIVTKYTKEWKLLNLNALSYMTLNKLVNPIHERDRHNVIYYGSFRKDRIKYFKKYFNDNTIIVSTHQKNEEKFNGLGVYPKFVSRINWNRLGLFPYKYSLYIEDEVTHINYNHLANRFYEALNYNCIPLFDRSCKNTLEKSGYIGYASHILTDVKIKKNQLPETIPVEWFDKAKEEKIECIDKIKKIVGVKSETDLEYIENVNNVNCLFKKSTLNKFMRKIKI